MLDAPAVQEPRGDGPEVARVPEIRRVMVVEREHAQPWTTSSFTAFAGHAPTRAPSHRQPSTIFAVAAGQTQTGYCRPPARPMRAMFSPSRNRGSGASAHSSADSGGATVCPRLAARRARIDGCGTAPAKDDWITDCAAQRDVRELRRRAMGRGAA